jgi:hypothetical protein
MGTTLIEPPTGAGRTFLALELGYDTFILASRPDPGTLRTFMEDVAPEARERIDTARTSDPTPPGDTQG